MPAKYEYVFIVIPARKNSKRLKNKNVKNFEGFPLFEWSLAAALYAKETLNSLGLSNVEIVCSSNDNKIIEIVIEKYFGLINLVVRDESLSGDDITLESVIIQAVEEIADKKSLIKPVNGRFILFQPTSPIRLKTDIIEFCEMFAKTKKEFSLLSANESYSEFKDIYSLREINNLDKSSWIVEKKLSKRGRLSKKSAFIDGSIYSGEISSLKRNTFIPGNKTFVFLQSIPWSVDIDTQQNFDEAVDALGKFMSEGVEIVKPEI